MRTAHYAPTLFLLQLFLLQYLLVLQQLQSPTMGLIKDNHFSLSYFRSLI